MRMHFYPFILCRTRVSINNNMRGKQSPELRIIQGFFVSVGSFITAIDPLLEMPVGLFYLQVDVNCKF